MTLSEWVREHLGRLPISSTTSAADNLPPLAPGPPLIGNVVDYLRRPLDFFTDQVAHNGPVFRMRLLGQDITVISASVGAPLVAADHAVCPLTRKGMFRAFATETSVDMFGADGAEHLRLRKMVRLGYARHVAAQFVPDMVDVTKQLIGGWRPGQVIEFLQASEAIALQCVMKALTPIDMSALVPDVGRLGNDVMYVTTGLRPDAIFKLPPYVSARRAVEHAIDTAIARHRAGELEEDGRMRMLDALLATREANGQPLSPRVIRGAAIYALCGTQLYMGRIITFLLYELLRNSHLNRLVEREVDAAFAAGPLSADVFRRMQHLRGAYVETLRKYPLVSGLAFQAKHTFEIEGYTVEQGSTILITSIADHYDAQGYSDPYGFDALRGANRRQSLSSGKFAPFGLRPRLCAAAGLVEVLVMSITCAIVHTLRFSLPAPSYRPRLALRPLLGPADRLPLTVHATRSDIDRIVDPSALSLDVDDDPLLVEHSDSLANFEVTAINVAAGEDVIRQGDPAHWFYVIVDGIADVHRTQPDGTFQHVAALQQGQIFGETGLLKGAPRNATVRARTELGLLRLDRETFLTLVAESDLLGQELGRLLQRRFMRRALADALPRLPGQLASSAVEGLELRQYSAGEVIIQQGEPAEHFFILVAGQAQVLAKDSNGNTWQLATLEKGTGFGEIGLLTRRARTATVRVSEDGPAVALRLDREHFEAIVSESPDASQDLSLIMQRRILRHIETLETSPTT